MDLDTADDPARDGGSAPDNTFDQFPVGQTIDDYTTRKSPKTLRVSVRDHDLPHQQAKWARLSKWYNDKYLDFFINNQDPEEVDSSLTTSQYGSVTWTGVEKERLFYALATKGRHNLPDLAGYVKTKSIVEIKDYLDRLKSADAEHQMFAAHAKNVSLAEMDAAVEIGEDWEDRLERVADALAVFQDKYDLAKARAGAGLWLIDTMTAEKIEEDNEAREMRQMEGSTQFASEEEEDSETLEIFRFRTMLELSRSLFMNSANESEHDHWTEYAEEDEEPSMTVEAAQVLYNLVKSLTQRVLQTSIFLAQSRIRSTTTLDYVPSKVLKDIDVVAALDLLNLPLDSWDYWTKFARRSGVDVVLGDHRKGQNDLLTLEQIESALSVRAARGRRRSLSSIVSQSSQEDQPDSQDEAVVQTPENDISQTIEEDLAHETSISEDDESSVPRIHPDSDEVTNEDDNDTEGAHDSMSNTRSYISRKRRRIMLEESQDEYLERLDHTAQLKEESLLQQLFGYDIVKEETEEGLPKRPRGQRKMKEDLRDWSETAYYSLWELKRPLHEDPDESFPANERLREED